ncbi:MAG: hypothetical protein QXO71_08440, partial [Candidatus Jordarchaeaceae archaeon]
MHLYLLRIAESPSISFFGAFTYMYIPYHLSESIAEAHGDLSLAYTLLPLLFLSYEELFMRANPRNIIISGIFTTFVILTHPQSFIILIAPFLAIYLLIKIVLEKPILKFVLKKSISLSTPVLSGLLLTMFWWLPYYSSINEFYNTSYNIEASLYYTANPLQALTLQAISTNIPNWGHFFGNTWEYMFSLTIPLMLAFSMYFIIRTHNKIGISMFVSYTVSLLFSLGLISPIPLYQYAFEYLPFFNSIRTPARFLFFTSFAAVVIICIGLKIAFNKFKFSKKKKFVIVVGLLLFIMVNSYTEVGLSFRTFPLPIPLLGSYFFLNNQPYGRIFTIPLNTWSQEPQQGTVINPMLWVFMYDKEILGVGAPNLLTRPVGEYINFLLYQLTQHRSINLGALCDVYGIEYIWVDKYNPLSSNYMYIDDAMEKIFENDRYVIYRNTDSLPKVFLLYQYDQILSNFNVSWSYKGENQSPVIIKPVANGIIVTYYFSSLLNDKIIINHTLSALNYTIFDEFAFDYRIFFTSGNILDDLIFGVSLFESDGSQYIINGITLDESGRMSIPLFLFQPNSFDENNQLDIDQICEIQIECSELTKTYQNKVFTIGYTAFRLVKNNFREIPFLKINNNHYIFWLNVPDDETMPSRKYIVLNYAQLSDWKLIIAQFGGLEVSIASEKILHLLNGFDITNIPNLYLNLLIN